MIQVSTYARRSSVTSGMGVLGVTAVIGALGIAFNLLRLALHLDQAPLLVSLAAFLLLTVVGAGIAHRLGMGREDLGLVWPRVMPTLAGTAIAVVTLAGIAWLTSPSVRHPSLAQVFQGLAFFGLGTAPAEELLFRGVMFGVLQRWRGAAVASVVTAIAFALIHVPVYGFGSLGLAVCAGFIFGWLRWWSGSLVTPIIAHVLADMAILWL